MSRDLNGLITWLRDWFDDIYLTEHQDITGKEDTSNKIASWSNTITGAHYPSAKLVKDTFDSKADTNHNHGNIKNDGTFNAVHVVDTYNMNVVTNNHGVISLEDKPTIPTDISDLLDTNNIIPSDVSDLTDTSNTAFTPKTHTHGNLQNDGSVGTSNNANKNVVTDSNGEITTEEAIVFYSATLPTASSSYEKRICIIPGTNGLELYFCDTQ